MNILESTDAYEAWLRKQLKGDVVEGDLRRKHNKMCEGAFPFLRATYWRWAEQILTKLPGLAGAPSVLAIGDIHIENFGTWRDVEGRVVWGVNDFDEAAEMPYPLDLVRLATSAALAQVKGMSLDAICGHIIRGCRAGLEQPQPIVLDLKNRPLRKTFVVSGGQRADFWRKMDPDASVEKARKKSKKCNLHLVPPKSYAAALEAARPDQSFKLTFWPRTAGAGSLGRPRFVGYGVWRGAPVVREAKAIDPSGWTCAHGGNRRLRCEEIASGPYRSPDPWYRLTGTILVRRLSPNNRKLDLGEVRDPRELVNPRTLEAMGRDLAAVHLGTRNGKVAIERDLRQRKGSLRNAVAAAAEFVRGEQKEWRSAYRNPS